MNFVNLTPTRFSPRKRNGLAPVEMVLALPLLMAFMGLIMVFGFVASWKVRSEVVARDVGFRARNPRAGGLHQRSEEWPELTGEDRSLDLSLQGASNLQSVDDQDIVHAPIIRGPLPAIEVDSDLLDFSRNVRSGVASVDQPSQVMGEVGRVNYEVSNDFLFDEFKYTTIRVGNFSRRIPILWDTDLEELYDFEAVSNLIFTINDLRDPIVLPIDEDLDFYFWNIRLLRSREIDEFGVEILEWRKWDTIPFLPDPRSYNFITDYSVLRETDFDEVRQRPRNFPRANVMQNFDVRRDFYIEGRDKIRSTVVESYLYQIPRVPLSMANRSRRLFQEVLTASQNDLVEPRLSEQEKNQLESWVRDLETFIGQQEARIEELQQARLAAQQQLESQQ